MIWKKEICKHYSSHNRHFCLNALPSWSACNPNSLQEIPCDFHVNVILSISAKHSASHLLAFSHVFWNTCHPLWRKMQSPFFNVTAGSQPAELENLFIPPRENPRRSPLHVTWALDIFSSLFFFIIPFV